MPPKKDRLPDVAQRIEAYRKAHGWTLDALAQKVGTKRAAVHHWEAGIREPSLAMLCRLADAFGCTTDRLLGRKPRRKPA